MYLFKCFKKYLEEPGFEPGAFRMQSECDTTTPHSLDCLTLLTFIHKLTKTYSYYNLKMKTLLTFVVFAVTNAKLKVLSPESLAAQFRSKFNNQSF
jgi:hypothetical protein